MEAKTVNAKTLQYLLYVIGVAVFIGVVAHINQWLGFLLVVVLLTGLFAYYWSKPVK